MKKLIPFLILFLFPCFANALNFGEVRNISRAIARDPIPTGGTPRISEVVVSSYVNIAVQEIAMFTWCLESTVDIPIVLGQREYDFDSDMIAVQRVAVDGQQLPSTSIAKLDSKSSGNWQTSISTQTPIQYYVNNGVVGFDVYPDTTTDTTIAVTYIEIPDTLINDTDIPFNSVSRFVPFHMAICFYTAALMCYQDNRPTEGDRYYGMYTDRIKNMSSTIRLTPDYYPSFSGNSNAR